ncbi:ABC transporter substrate-binding protein [Anaeroselena agilis]|uniref:Thiamine pyrimidine synthase n=1 Tax=Anaeroselena agilis TaxID=3063788 RepID=A0ABU3NSR4_9FIRM|nr:ABC transporter substrate-binding protein [Selenomonadales bacterium 4137-cl]
MRPNKTFLIVLAAVLAAALLSPTPPAAAAGKPVELMLQWTHQAQFAGYYVAAAKGIYKAHGLDVRIIAGGPGLDPMNELADGNVDFVSAWLSTALIRREEGLPLVNVAQIVNRSNLLMISWKDWAGGSPRDLDGRRISVWEGDFRAPYLAWLQAEGVEPAAIYPQYYSVNLFLRRGVDACSAMYYNEYHMLYQAGVNEDERSVFFLKDYGFGFPEDGLYCTENTIRLDREMVAAFRAASLEGWRYAAEHPDEALDITMEYVTAANVATNRPHMKWMLEKILTSIVPGGKDPWTLGKLARDDYEKTVQMMRGQKMLHSQPTYEAFTGEVTARVP